MAKSQPIVNRTLKPLLKCQTGIQGLDEITFEGLPKARPTLVCCGAGCAKTSLVFQFIDFVCNFGGKALFFTFEESESQVFRNRP